MALASPTSDIGSCSACAGGEGQKGLRSLEESRVGRGECRQPDLATQTGSWQRGNVSAGDLGHTSGLGFIGKSKNRPQPSWSGWDWKIK